MLYIVQRCDQVLPVHVSICLYLCATVCMQKKENFTGHFNLRTQEKNDTLNGDKAHIPKGKVKLKLLQHCT